MNCNCVEFNPPLFGVWMKEEGYCCFHRCPECGGTSFFKSDPKWVYECGSCGLAVDTVKGVILN
jgi:hypothetical protein